jgi:hypothetical protein
VKGEGSQLPVARWKDPFIDADESIVVPSKEREVSESSFCVADDASNLE